MEFVPHFTLFLSYRRKDLLVLGTAPRIYDRLTQYFGPGSVFMDVDVIPPGSDFRAVIDDWMARSNVLLVVIGPQWAELMAERGGQTNDFVKLEIESAIKRGIPVIPLLIGPTKMPGVSDLPESLVLRL